MKSYEIRQMWLDFFKSKGHSVEPSASLVPVNDPTLLWTNAGVTPLKKYFDGTMVPNNPRITNAQKCIRTNDIENVGKTARHHTFFEMLGNFSIGDYFKPEAIKFAVELLFDPKWFGFDKNKLYITYYTKDLDAKKFWMENGIAEDHLIPLDGNFWEIGEGPCGPDTEMFYDRGEKYDKRGKELIENDIENDRFIEIWNIVFSQFNSKEGVKREDYKELPSKNIDTGCGLERLCCVMQGVDTNYDTDLFMPIIKKTEEISGVKYNGQMAFKVIADHVRTVTFAVADGATLSNEGRGYVLRRVLRRASKYAKSLGIDKPFMAELVDVVIQIMEPFYPYLHEKKDIVKQVITAEEKQFLKTLADGEKRFNLIASSLNGKVIAGADAFTLYDTYGFPIELTIEYAEEKGLTVDVEGFKKYLNEQKERARNARKDEGSMGGQNEEFLNFKAESRFSGYEATNHKAKVIAKFGNAVVLDETPFYAFSGGQLPDKGKLDDYVVKDVIKMPNGQHLHILEVEENPFEIGELVWAVVDKENRDLTRKNHSSAHLLQAALQHVVGNHVHQMGSQVCADYCRFDFNNYQPLTDEEILKVEDLVNKYIAEAHCVATKVLPIEEAKKLGAMALFGEKYGSKVRVVDMEVSKEFCAGTHVANTSEVIDFEIASVESIGSGVFRVTALTGNNALNLLKDSTKNIQVTIDTIKNKMQDLISKAKAEGIILTSNYQEKEINEKGYRYILALRKMVFELQNAQKDLEKEYNQKKSQNALKGLSQFDSLIEGDKLFATVDETNTNLIKDMASALLNNKNLSVCFLANVQDTKVTFVCAAKAPYDACMLVKEACKITGGGGGGKKDLAQAGGKDSTKANEAISHVKELVK
ncbi:MAG: alanine--tRNA ligase [Acholeplasmatales bacterium]|nr:alanine--tRNA ligase [Acholeplasmatales bacterium]